MVCTLCSKIPIGIDAGEGERGCMMSLKPNPKVRILSLSSLSPSKAFPPLLLLLTTYTSISMKTHSPQPLLTVSPLPKPINHDTCLYSLPPSLPHTYLTHPSPSRFHFFFTTNLIANIHIKKTFSHPASSPTPPSLH